MIFQESNHSYTHDKKRYTSVTTLYKKLKQVKDWDLIAKKYAAKNGETAEYWKDVWAKNRDESAGFGSLYHLSREFGTTKVELADLKESIDLSNLSDGEYKELIIYSHYYRVAGQADLITIKNGEIRIRDYKTCRKIDTEATAYYNVEKRRKIKEKYLPPISHLDVFDLNDFSLQLSLYAYMLEEYGYKIDKLIIEHIEFEERGQGYAHLIDSLNKGTLKEISTDYEVPYLREEAYAILENHRYSL